MVTGFEFVILKAQLKYRMDDGLFLRTVHYRIDREEVEEDIKMIQQAEINFWQQCQKKERPALILPEI